MIKAAVICECIRRLHDARAYRVLGMALALHGCVAQDVAENQDNRAAEASRIYAQKGVRYMENGQLDIALQDMTHALALDDANISAHNALAVLYERTGRLPEAEQQYRQALALDASDTATLNNYGRFLCEQGAYARAQEYFDQAGRNRLYATPWLVLTNAGVCLHRAGKPAQAEDALRNALSLNAGFAPALLEMASVKLDDAQFADARGYFQRYEASTAQPAANALWVAIRIAAELQDKKSLDAYLGELRRRFPDSAEARAAERRYQ